ncbi:MULTISPECIES: hypothetical protein [unclassified Streptomyces]|uniref:hypothetical protein n=1 Tax=unclassified Streptomyces TaxID=2593676 RepID=UPI000805DA26|nr:MULTISPECIES: hypothetical protein [unclassified Streptomyces]MYR76547.1 hypothetical protein [Streptomyces sp. SID4925]SBV00040.1 hypothetical protein YUMDRAFT_06314 [Streptomyces sp. OspMP-M45]
MAELTTENVIRHTLHLAPEELRALRQAAKAALGAYLDAPEADKATWQAFIDLGKPPTRGRGFVEQHANPTMIGTTPGP